MLDQSHKTKGKKGDRRFKEHARRQPLKRRKPIVLGSLTEEQRAFLCELLIQRNEKYEAVADAYLARFGRRMAVSTLHRFFTKESRPKAATHDEITIHFSVRLTVPKGANIRVEAGEVQRG